MFAWHLMQQAKEENSLMSMLLVLFLISIFIVVELPKILDIPTYVRKTSTIVYSETKLHLVMNVTKLHVSYDIYIHLVHTTFSFSV